MLLWSLKNWQGVLVGLALGASFGLMTGYIKGRASVQFQQLKDTVRAHETRNKIDDGVSRHDTYRLCIELGGLSNDCRELRGLEAPSKAK